MNSFNDEGVKNVLKSLRDNLSESNFVRKINYPDLEIIVKGDFDESSLDEENFMDAVYDARVYDDYFIAEYSFDFDYGYDRFKFQIVFNDEFDKTYFPDDGEEDEMGALSVANDIKDKVEKQVRRYMSDKRLDIYHSWE